MTTKQLLLVAAVLKTLSATAQPGALDNSFQPAVNSLDAIRAIALQPDGKILVGEKHGTVFTIGTSRVKRLNPDGSLDTTFSYQHETNAGIRKLLVQPNGKILVAGDFDTLGNLPLKRLARLHADGSIDTSFHTGTGFNSGVYAIGLQTDGKIVAGGLFTEYDGFACNRLARLHADGTIDTTFRTAFGANASVEDLIIMPDGRIIISGDFTAYEGENNIRFARVNADGSRDTTIKTPSGAGAVVFAMALQPDGKMLLGGNFLQYNFQPNGRLVRIQPNGDIDALFNVGAGANSTMRQMLLLPNGDAIIAGNFTTFKGIPSGRLLKVNAQCGVDTVDFLTGSGADNEIYALKQQADGKLLAAGMFDNYNQTAVPKLMRLYNCLTPRPGNIIGDSIVNCPNTTLTFSIPPVPSAIRYEWKLPAGWAGSGDSTSITVVSNGSPGTVSVRAFSDACGFSYPQTKVVNNSSIPAPGICLVTVDSASTHNIVVWEKQPTNLIDSFCIYREITNNVYTKIASVPYDSLSEYHDYDADPNTTSYRYKLSTIDTCGVESELSVFHNTIHLQYIGMGNFQWTFYQIQPGINPVISFNVYRDNFNNGNFSQIGFVSGSNATFTDVSYTSFPDANYVVDVNWGISCTPSRAVNTTRSNKRPTKELLISVDDVTYGSIRISPNPAQTSFNIDYSEGLKILQVEMFNSMGQKVIDETNARHISVESFPKGVYVLALQTNAGRVVKKVVVE